MIANVKKSFQYQLKMNIDNNHCWTTALTEEAHRRRRIEKSVLTY